MQTVDIKGRDETDLTTRRQHSTSLVTAQISLRVERAIDELNNYIQPRQGSKTRMDRWKSVDKCVLKDLIMDVIVGSKD